MPTGPAAPIYARRTITANDETQLVVHEWAPARPVPTGTVVLFIHGIGMHGEPYKAIAPGFTSKGITLLALDLRGHGRSGGERATLAEPSVLCPDIDAVIDDICNRDLKSKIYLMGDSMGGLIASEYARREQQRLAGLVLMVPGYMLHHSRLLESSNVGKIISTGLIPIDTKENLAASTRVPGFSKAKLADPLATRSVKPGYALRLGQMSVNWPWNASELKLPIYLCLAGNDKVVSNQISRQVFARVSTPPAGKEFRVWKDSYHTLCWDPETPEIIDEITAWILR